MMSTEEFTTRRELGAAFKKGQRPKSITQHSHPETATPWIDPAQDLVGRPNEKSAFENYVKSNA
jgi:hypothetical protein